MEERQVTVDGVSYELARPFLVMATQNPLEMEGTYPLPEAQRDRFTTRVSMGYPDQDAELAMLDDRATTDPLAGLHPVADAASVSDLIAAVGRLHVSEAVRRYVVDLVGSTRRSPHLRLGASPRAGLQLLRAARASAALAGRDMVLPDDVKDLAGPVLAHRPPPSTWSPSWWRRCRSPAGVDAGAGTGSAADRADPPWPVAARRRGGAAGGRRAAGRAVGRAAGRLRPRPAPRLRARGGARTVPAGGGAQRGPRAGPPG
jgi:hypothetical protein